MPAISNASNICFDFLTLLLSWQVLKGMRQTHSGWGILAWVAADLLLAGILAVCSLWIGMIPGNPDAHSLKEWLASLPHNTFFHYSPRQIISVLWKWDDPYFGIMHTTFIPTILRYFWLMGAVLISLIGLEAVWTNCTP